MKHTLPRTLLLRFSGIAISTAAAQTQSPGPSHVPMQGGRSEKISSPAIAAEGATTIGAGAGC